MGKYNQHAMGKLLERLSYELNEDQPTTASLAPAINPKLLRAYIAGQLSSEDSRAFEQLLCANPAAKRQAGQILSELASTVPASPVGELVKRIREGVDGTIAVLAAQVGVRPTRLQLCGAMGTFANEETLSSTTSVPAPDGVEARLREMPDGALVLTVESEDPLLTGNALEFGLFGQTDAEPLVVRFELAELPDGGAGARIVVGQVAALRDKYGAKVECALA